MSSSFLLETVDIYTFWLLNISASFMLSAAHNVLFFVLDWRTPVIHFLHFASAFTFFSIKTAFTPDRGVLLRLLFGEFFRPPLRIIFWKPLLAQLIVCLLSSIVHSQNRTGGLYLVRLFDFLGTLLVIGYGPKILGEDEDPNKRRAISLLLVWLLEFGHIEYDPLTVWISPFLALAQGLHLLLLKRSQLLFFGAFQQQQSQNNHENKNEKCEDKSYDEECNQQTQIISFSPLLFQRFALCYTFAMTSLLFIPALISYSQSIVPYDASWESIDIGQWFLQNMAHATVFAAVGKAVFVASALRYFTRMGEMRSKEKCCPKISNAEGVVN
uniref:7TM_GPCR_Srx domain-containing protein n=1 Tax=Meloidogyne hapla TaxID=6305 RepID=A0A1I8BNN4_MELHA